MIRQPGNDRFAGLVKEFISANDKNDHIICKMLMVI